MSAKEKPLAAGDKGGLGADQGRSEKTDLIITPTVNGPRWLALMRRYLDGDPAAFWPAAYALRRWRRKYYGGAPR